MSGICRNPDQVKERLDRLIGAIQKIQMPFINGGEAPDVLVVLSFPSLWLITT